MSRNQPSDELISSSLYLLRTSHGIFFPSMRLGQSMLHAAQGTQMTGRSRVLRSPMVKTAGAFASLLPTRRSEGLPGTHPLVQSISWQTLQLVPPCFPTPQRQCTGPRLSPRQKSRISEPSYPMSLALSR